MREARQLGLISTRTSAGAPASRVLLVGGFQLVEGEAQVVLAEGSQRLLALLALRGRPVKRLLVAGTLWPDVTEGRAYASLRSALSRLYGAVRDSVEVNPGDLSLAPNVRVDLRESQALAHRLLDAVDEPLQATDLSRAAIAALSGELLPDWYDDWVLLEARTGGSSGCTPWRRWLDCWLLRAATATPPRRPSQQCGPIHSARAHTPP
jgi:hypothetical protein